MSGTGIWLFTEADQINVFPGKNMGKMFLCLFIFIVIVQLYLHSSAYTLPKFASKHGFFCKFK